MLLVVFLVEIIIRLVRLVIHIILGKLVLINRLLHVLLTNIIMLTTRDHLLVHGHSTGHHLLALPRLLETTHRCLLVVHLLVRLWRLIIKQLLALHLARVARRSTCCQVLLQLLLHCLSRLSG